MGEEKRWIRRGPKIKLYLSEIVKQIILWKKLEVEQGMVISMCYEVISMCYDVISILCPSKKNVRK